MAAQAVPAYETIPDAVDDGPRLRNRTEAMLRRKANRHGLRVTKWRGKVDHGTYSVIEEEWNIRLNNRPLRDLSELWQFLNEFELREFLNELELTIRPF